MELSIKKRSSLKELMQIPGVGISIAGNLSDIGIYSINDLKEKNPEILYELSNKFAGVRQDRCLLYVFRCAVYFANTKKEMQDPAMLKWWNWKDVPH